MVSLGHLLNCSDGAVTLAGSMVGFGDWCMGSTAHWGSMSPPHEEESQVHSAALPQLLAFLGTL